MIIMIITGIIIGIIIIIIIIVVVVVVVVLDLVALTVAGGSKVSARSSSSFLCFFLTNMCYARMCDPLADLKSVCSSQYLEYLRHNAHRKGGSFEVPV